MVEFCCRNASWRSRSVIRFACSAFSLRSRSFSRRKRSTSGRSAFGGAAGLGDDGLERVPAGRRRFTHETVPNHAAKYKRPELLLIESLQVARAALFYFQEMVSTRERRLRSTKKTVVPLSLPPHHWVRG